MSKRTPLYEEHKKLGGKLVDFAGWELPVQYSGITDEHDTVRNTAGLFDVSHMGTIEIKGERAACFLDYITPSDNTKLPIHKAQYSLLLKEDGTIIDDIIIYRLEEDHFLIVVNATNRQKDINWIKKHQKGHIEINDISSDIALIAIQGPKSAEILSKLTTARIEEIKSFHIERADIKGIGEVILARTGYTGEDGFEIFVDSENAVKLWRTLLEQGKDLGLKPVGLAARDTLRLEMKYALYGNEINEEINALESGLRWVIKFKKPKHFIGKTALLKIKEEGVKRRLIGFKMLEKAVPRHGYKIFSDGKEVGFVTSGTFSPTLKVPIGIGYIQASSSKPGTKISVDIRGKERQAEVVETPFYKKN